MDKFTALDVARYTGNTGMPDATTVIGLDNEPRKYVLENIKASQWQPIETAPKGAWFLGLIEGIPYKCKVVMNKGLGYAKDTEYLKTLIYVICACTAFAIISFRIMAVVHPEGAEKEPNAISNIIGKEKIN